MHTISEHNTVGSMSTPLSEEVHREHTEFIKTTIAKLLSAEAQLFQIHAFEAIRTLVAFPIRGTVGVWDGQAVPCHLSGENKN